MRAAFILGKKALHGSALTSFDLKNFCNPKKVTVEYPQMSYLKAAQVRGLVPIVAELCHKYDDGGPDSKHICALMDRLCTVYSIVHDADMVLAPDVYRLFFEAGQNFLLEYNFLAQQAEDAGLCRWSVVPKFHYFFHLLQQAQETNPRWLWCYGGEDLVGKASNLAHSCLRGTPSFLVPQKLFEKYRVAMHLKWSRL